MRSIIFLLTGLLGLATFTSAMPSHNNPTPEQLLGHLPHCARPAVSRGVTQCLKPGGQSIDKPCVCEDHDLIEQMKAQVKAACSKHKYNKTIKRARKICPDIQRD